jgi:hypothetical protein
MMAFNTFIIRVCAIVGGIYAVSSIFESLLRNSISIFGFGGYGDEVNEGVGKSTMKRKMKKVLAPTASASTTGAGQYNEAPSVDEGSVNTGSIELESIRGSTIET